MPLIRFLVPLAVLFAATLASADEVSDKQKKVALANLKKAEIARGAAVECETVILAGPLSETRLKAIGDSLSKTTKLARKALQFDEKEEPWKGKLTVVFLPERKDFTQYLRDVVGQRAEGNWSIDVRSDEPYVVSGVELNAKATDADIVAELGPLVTGAMMQAKIGSAARAPGWVRIGLGRAVSMRAEGAMSRRFTTYKSQARVAVLGGGGKAAAPIADIWTSDRADGGLLATSLMDYLAFGPGSANFSKFLSGLRPDENGADPAIAAVIEGAGWKTPAELDAAWKKWVTAGSPVK
jgi:hypothetical protein